MFEIIAFDADDTLWHCEDMFQNCQARLSEILDQYAPHDKVQEKLHDLEVRNIKIFGFGVKGFTLSMTEAAIELSDYKINAKDIHEIIMMGKDMLEAPMRLMDGVRETLEELHGTCPLWMITKGDVMDQSNKIEKSGLTPLFDEIEIVSKKDVPTYRDLFAARHVDPAKTLMIGNSMPSDILPVLELGGQAVHIPYQVTASFERHDRDPVSERFHRCQSIQEIPGLVARLTG